MNVELNIDRLVLQGMGVEAPDMERFLMLLEGALQRQIPHAAAAGRVEAGSVLRVEVPPIELQETRSLGEMADAIARRIALLIREGNTG